jgi:hypothetical protein
MLAVAAAVAASFARPGRSPIPGREPAIGNQRLVEWRAVGSRLQGPPAQDIRPKLRLPLVAVSCDYILCRQLAGRVAHIGNF